MNEIWLTLGGQTCALRPDYAQLGMLEEKFERPLFEIAELFIEGKARLRHIVEALAIILAWPGAPRELGEEIVAAGIAAVLQKLQAYFLAALDGSEH